jgi:protein-disulfide isomerase
MTLRISSRLASAIVAGFILLAPQYGRSQDLRSEIDAIIKDYLATHPEEVTQIVKNYLVQHPEVAGEILAGLLKRRPQAASAAATTANPKLVADRDAAVTQDSTILFASPHQVTLGNPAGDVTLVEFFDYNCGYCKRALGDMTGILKSDPKLRIVLKEFPILGPGSVEAARVAIAVRMQDPAGQKYLAFHQAMLSGRGPANKDTALAAAKDAGLDIAQIEKDIDSAEVKETLDESAKLARELTLNGTPSYVVGKDVMVGAVGMAALNEKIKAARGM